MPRRWARIVDGTTAMATSSIVPTVTVTAAIAGATPGRSETTSTATEWCPAAKASGITKSSATSSAAPAGERPGRRRPQHLGVVEADDAQAVAAAAPSSVFSMRSRHVARSPGAADSTGVSGVDLHVTPRISGGLPDLERRAPRRPRWAGSARARSRGGRRRSAGVDGDDEVVGRGEAGERVAAVRRRWRPCATACDGRPGKCSAANSRTTAPHGGPRRRWARTTARTARSPGRARSTWPNSDACGSRFDGEVDDVGGDDVDEEHRRRRAGQAGGQRVGAGCDAGELEAAERVVGRAARRAASDPSLSWTDGPGDGRAAGGRAPCP